MASSTKIGSLVVDVDGDIDKLRAEMRSAVGVVTTMTQDVQARTAALKNSFDTVLNPIRGMTALLGPLAAGFGAILSINAFGNLVNGAAEAAGKLYDLSMQTGITVEQLSALEEVGKLSDVSLDTIANTANKMSKNLASATEEGKGIASALRALNIDFDTFRKLSPDQQMLTVAKAMDNFADGGGKSAAAMAIMGKEGAAMIPFLKDLAAAGELNAKVTSEQAAMADNYGDNLVKIRAASDAWKKQLALSMLPVMEEMTGAWLAATNSNDGLGGSIKRLAADGTFTTWARNAVIGVTYLIDVGHGLLSLLPLIGTGIAGMAAAGSAAFGAIYDAYLKVKEGDLNGAWDSLKTGATQVGTIAKETGQDISKIWNQELLGEKIRKGMDQVRAARKEIAAEDGKQQINFKAFASKDDDTKATKEKITAYDNLVKSINEKIAVQSQEIETGQALTDAEKLASKVMVELRDGVLKLTEVEKKHLGSLLEQMLAEEKSNATSKEMIKLGADLVKSGNDQLKSLDAQIEAAAKQNEEIGLTKEQVDQLAISRMQMAASADEELAANVRVGANYAGDLKDAYLEYASSLEEAAKKKRELANIKENTAERQADFDEEKKQQAERTSFWESLDKTAHDTFVSIANGGKDAATRLRETFKNIFFDYIYQMGKQMVVNVAFNASASGSGVGGGAGGSLSSLSSMYSSGKALWDGFSLAGTVGGGIGQLGSLFGSTSMSAFASGMSGTAAGTFAGAGPTIAGSASGLGAMAGTGGTTGVMASGSGAAAGAAGAGSSAAAAIPIVGWVLAGMMANNSLFDKGWGAKPDKDTKLAGIASGLSANVFTDTLQKWFGFSDKTASMFTGSAVVNRLFGHKNPELQQSEFTGSFGADGYSGSTRDVFKQQGGLFRGDKWSETKTAATNAEAMNAIFGSIKQAAAGYASQLGLSAKELETFSKDFKFNLSITGDAAKDAAANEKLFSDLVTGVTDDISKLLFPSLEKFKVEGESAYATFARVASTFATVNQGFDALGLKLFEIGEEGIKASDKFTAAVGGLQSFQAAQASFYQNFYSEEERSSELKKQLTSELQKQNLALPESRKGYRALLEEISKTGTPEQLATLFKLNATFASVFAATEEVNDALTTTAQKMAEQSLAIEGAIRRDELQSRREAEAAADAIRQASESAFQTLVQSVEAGMTDLIRAGDAGAALASQMSITRIDKARYTNADGSFNAGGFNLASAQARAGMSKDLINAASSDALNVQNVTGFIQDLMLNLFSDDIMNSMKTGLAASIKLPANSLIGQAVDGLLEASVKQYQLQYAVPRGEGIASVLAAQMDLRFASYDKGMMSQGIGADVNAYGESLVNLGWLLKNGKITHDDYANAVESVKKAIGDNIVLYGDQEAQLDRVNKAQQALVDAGLDSISYYFNQIGKSVADLNAEAVKANAPLAQINASIGRMSSLADVFSLSAKAALSSGGNTDSLSVQNAQIVAEAASRASALMTTADARRAATELSGRASFSGMDERQLRDVSLILDGINQFDSRSFETAFMRMNDALNRGVVTQDQYQDMFSQSIDAYQGVDEVTKSLSSSMQRLSDSMGSFADQLLIDPARSGLTPEVQREALMSQYDRAKISAATGDAESINRFQSLAKNVLDLNYKSQAEFNAMAGIVYADARRLEAVGASQAKTDGQQVVEQLQKNNEALNKKLEDVKLILSEIMVRTGRTVDAVDRQTVTQVLNK